MNTAHNNDEEQQGAFNNNRKSRRRARTHTSSIERVTRQKQKSDSSEAHTVVCASLVRIRIHTCTLYSSRANCHLVRKRSSSDCTRETHANPLKVANFCLAEWNERKSWPIPLKGYTFNVKE